MGHCRFQLGAKRRARTAEELPFAHLAATSQTGKKRRPSANRHLVLPFSISIRQSLVSLLRGIWNFEKGQTSSRRFYLPLSPCSRMLSSTMSLCHTMFTLQMCLLPSELINVQSDFVSRARKSNSIVAASCLVNLIIHFNMLIRLIILIIYVSIYIIVR